ncbi:MULTISPECIES: hypothetical protein [Calothrix]|uniref:Uncharacterized protein n=2 Tax=Calothrix TaxID=1186 RepID=A0ABR8A5I6_9CYAN|nr:MULTISPECIES: hypothetical protein [Calothrix]MBD2195242.1 hypothetical protein [Calothrix parietina FACHB-288]MBD2223787.1 hypothetical protein [Calothrix anomala FACHB-343]
MSTFNILSGEVEIYEFSRGFTEVLENERWISGGFGNAIDRSNYNEEIPSPIRQFINNNQNIFGIPTGFAPAEEQVALIARVIDNRYCVLAVANSLGKDNRGRDGVVGYRYFWLDTYSMINQHLPAMDGVATLLNWWSKNPLVFDMNPESFTGEELVCKEYIEDTENYHPEQPQDYPVYPQILTIADYQSDRLIELHYQAAQTAKKMGIPLAWAWNVRKLNFPSMYIAIWCENEAAKQTIERELARNDVGDAEVNPAPIQIVQRVDKDYLTRDEKSIEKILDDLISANYEKIITEKVQALVEILCNATDLDWNKFFVDENQHIKHLQQDENPIIESVKYYALMPILVPDRIGEWLAWLRKSNNQEYIKASCKTQNLLIKYCHEQQKHVLVKQIYDGISFLFYQILKRDINTYHNSRWLLAENRNNVWAELINPYVKDYLIYIERKCTITTEITEEFGGEITNHIFSGLANMLMNYQPKPNQNRIGDILSGKKANINHLGLNNLANLLQEIAQTELNPIRYLFNQYDRKILNVNLLSAIFYQYSEDSIPSPVFSKLNPFHKGTIRTILRIPEPQERGHSLKIWRNRLLVLLVILSMPTLLLYAYLNLSNYILQNLSGSSNLSLEEIIESCKNIDTNNSSTESSEQELKKCELQLQKIVNEKINVINGLNKQQITDEEKSQIRNSEIYSDVANMFIYPRVYLHSSYPEKDQYVLEIMNYFQLSFKQKKSYQQILPPLEKCAIKTQIEDFQACLQNLDNK